MNNIKDIMYYPNLDESVRAGLTGKSDPQKAAKQVEQVFLGELLKNMLENTEFGKGQIVSSYMPYITSEVAKSLTDRGIGIHEFLMKSPSFRDMVSKDADKGTTDKPAAADTGAAIKLKFEMSGKLSNNYSQNGGTKR
ncbi:MAG TPA: hypothetical protein VK452_10295 [Dissulfurispiraceae bacterium]|nr:hypothetical protein [Dissulfurispiraceae bacterium]